MLSSRFMELSDGVLLVGMSMSSSIVTAVAQLKRRHDISATIEMMACESNSGSDTKIPKTPDFLPI